jgi:hypothetical protein
MPGLRDARLSGPVPAETELRLFQNFSFWNSNLGFKGKSGL